MRQRIKILFVFGTRPEVIKMAPVITECRKHKGRIMTRVCVTGQHRQMIDPLLKLFKIPVDFDLKIMKKDQDLEYITSTVLKKVGRLIDTEKPDYLLVQGDTTSAMAASLAAYYKRVKVGHIEAGLRTWDKFHPYPEEVNRQVIDSVSDLYFAHTQNARKNLLIEGIAAKKIGVTGNTVIDALLGTAGKKYAFAGTVLARVPMDRKVVLLTAHRRENFGQPIKNICQAVKKLAQKYSNEIFFVYPVHLNPNIQKPVHDILKGLDNVLLTSPLEYLPLVHLLKRSHFVLTDSGGLQEEAPSLGKPVLVLRQTTERPEGIKAGCVEVIGTQEKNIIACVEEFLRNKKKYTKMSKAANPYGDGLAAKRIVERILRQEVS